MSSTASNYGLERLRIGIAIAAMASVFTLWNISSILLAQKDVGIWTLTVTVLYGGMMFASSYVEEEHNFWYWATSGWLGWLFLRR